MRPLLQLLALVGAVARPSMNVLRVAAAVQDGETVTIGSTVYEADTNGSVTSGRVAVDVSGGSSAAANKLLTFAANPTAADTVTIGATVYTFRAAVGATANEVLVGADLTATRNNLVAAVNAASGAGTTYGSATVINASATASATSTDGLTATAKIKGTAGNSIAIAESAAQLSWAGGATALSGGVDPTATEFAAALITAINGSVSGFRAQAGVTGEVIITATNGELNAAACSETLAGANNAWAAAAAYGGASPDESILPVTVTVRRAAVAVEVALDKMRFPLGFTPTVATCTVRTSAGVAKAWDGVLTLSANMVTADNSGSSDWAAGDLVTIIASR